MATWPGRQGKSGDASRKHQGGWRHWRVDGENQRRFLLLVGGDWNMTEVPIGCWLVVNDYEIVTGFLLVCYWIGIINCWFLLLEHDWIMKFQFSWEVRIIQIDELFFVSEG